LGKDTLQAPDGHRFHGHARQVWKHRHLIIQSAAGAQHREAVVRGAVEVAVLGILCGRAFQQENEHANLLKGFVVDVGRQG
jgi:hypothetical protein